MRHQCATFAPDTHHHPAEHQTVTIHILALRVFKKARATLDRNTQFLFDQFGGKPNVEAIWPGAIVFEPSLRQVAGKILPVTAVLCGSVRIKIDFQFPR